MFVDGGGRIVDEKALSAHDEKLLGARQRRQRQLAEKRGSSGGPQATDPRAQATDRGVAAAPLSANLTAAPMEEASRSSCANAFDKSMNFGQGGVVGFLVQRKDAATTPSSSSGPGSGSGGAGSAGGVDQGPTQIC